MSAVFWDAVFRQGTASVVPQFANLYHAALAAEVRRNHSGALSDFRLRRAQPPVNCRSSAVDFRGKRDTLTEVRMKCFTHSQSEAVGTCKYCFKGVCTECAKDTGIGIVCSPECHEQVKLVKAMMDRNKQAFPIAAKSHFRNAILLSLFGVLFAAFGIMERSDSFTFRFFLSFAAIMVIGAVFSFLISRKFAKSSRT